MLQIESLYFLTVYIPTEDKQNESEIVFNYLAQIVHICDEKRLPLIIAMDGNAHIQGYTVRNRQAKECN